MSDSPLFDAIVIGGGPAGLSAALALGRSRRRVLLAADGPTRNASTHAAQNVFTRDGTPPDELVRIGRAQLEPYDVTFRNERAVDAEKTDTGVAVTFEDGDRFEARGLILATGVRDVLPDVPGFDELWGTGVFHCPYCHGWEVAGQPLALYNRDASALDLARLIRGWSDDLILFTDGGEGLSDEDRAQIERNGITVRDERVERLQGKDGMLEAVVLRGGEAIPRAGLFVWPDQEQRSDLAMRLGCALTDEGRVEADEYGRTHVAGVFVAGDAGPNPQAVAPAAASGTTAGAMLNHDLLEHEFKS